MSSRNLLGINSRLGNRLSTTQLVSSTVLHFTHSLLATLCVSLSPLGCSCRSFSVLTSLALATAHTMDIDLPPAATSTLPAYPSPPFCFKSLPAELRCSVIESFSSSANPAGPADLDTLRSLSFVDRECSKFACSVLWRVSSTFSSHSPLANSHLYFNTACRIPLQIKRSTRDLPPAHRSPSQELDQGGRSGRSVPEGAGG